MLKDVTLPKGIKTLPVSLFYGCEAIDEIDVPETVESIGTDAFCGCTALRRVSFHNAGLKLMPRATEGLQNAELTLAGKPFECREITAQTELRALTEDGEKKDGVAGEAAPDLHMKNEA